MLMQTVKAVEILTGFGATEDHVSRSLVALTSHHIMWFYESNQQLSDDFLVTSSV